MRDIQLLRQNFRKLSVVQSMVYIYNSAPLGRVAGLKYLILSKIIHLWILLPNPLDSLVEALKKTVFQFVWNRKKDNNNNNNNNNNNKKEEKKTG